MYPRRSLLRRQLETVFRWTLQALEAGGWAMAPTLPYIPLEPAVTMGPVPPREPPAAAPVLPAGHPDRFDPNPPTEVERRLWAAALAEP